MVNPYEQLELPNKASIEECRISFRRLAKKYHPDVNKEPGALEKFLLIKKSLDFLSDPERKAAFDNPQPHPQPVITVTWYSTGTTSYYG